MSASLTPLAPRREWLPRFAHAHPAFATLAPYAARFEDLDDFPPVALWSERLADLALTAASGAPLRFVPQPPRRRRGAPASLDDLYDVRIHERGEVPSRPRNWHDLLNMLCWAAFPRAKAAVAARQHRALRQLPPDLRALPGARTRERDALAMLDEGAVLVGARDPAAVDALLRAGDHDAILALVARGEATAAVFGHAVYEHLVSSEATVRAMPVALPAGDLDGALAQRLADVGFLAEPPPVAALPVTRALFAR